MTYYELVVYTTEHISMKFQAYDLENAIRMAINCHLRRIHKIVIKRFVKGKLERDVDATDDLIDLLLTEEK